MWAVTLPEEEEKVVCVCDYFADVKNNNYAHAIKRSHSLLIYLLLFSQNHFPLQGCLFDDSSSTV